MVSKEYVYRTRYSTEDEEFVTTCESFPSLSWLESTPEASLTGMMSLVDDVVEDLRNNGETIPVPGVQRSNYLSTPESYGIANPSRLVKPDRYYFDGRVLHDENWQLPKGISRSDADMFPKWFLYRGEMIKDTVPCDLQPGMVEALREVYEETGELRCTAYAGRVNPYFAASVRFTGWDCPLYVWGWQSIYRMYTNLGEPCQFVLEQ